MSTGAKTRKHLPLIEREAMPDAVRVDLPDGTGFSLERRDFLRLGAMATAAAGLTSAAGCAAPKEEILPMPVRPEEARVGLALNYATTCFACPAGCGMVAKAREGRVIKTEGNALHPLNGGALCARGQATVLELYDGDRARRSLRVARGKEPALGVSPQDLDKLVLASLEKVKGSSKLRLLTGALNGRATKSLIAEFIGHFPGSRHVAWEPLSPMVQVIAEAQKRSYGEALVPQYHLDKAGVIVAFGAEFLDTWLSPVQFAADFAKRRSPEGRGMSRLWVFEGRMSLTGSNADRRVRVRPSHFADIALALAHEIIVVKKFGADPEVVKALDGKGIAAVAAKVGVPEEVLRETASLLIKNAGRSLVLAGASASTDSSSGLLLEVAVNLLNSTLSNDGVTVDYQQNSRQYGGPHADLAQLVDDMRAGKVDVLIVAGSNPVFSAPPVLGFAEAMSKVPFVLAIADRVDETALRADLLCAAAHSLESWLDAEPLAGVMSVAQPAMQPIGEMRGLTDVLVSWGGGIAATGRIGKANELASKSEQFPSPGYHYIREYWKDVLYPTLPIDDSFDSFWTNVLHRGVIRQRVDTSVMPARRSFDVKALAVVGSARKQGEMELVLFAPHSVYDGRSGNTGWLFEYPDPVSKITWDNWAALSPKRMKRLGVENGDYVEVTANGWTQRLPAFEQAGQHDDVVSVPLGFGRSEAGVVGNGIGLNGFQLADMGQIGPQFSGHGAVVKKGVGKSELAIPQGESVIDLNVRPLIPVAKLSEFKQNPSKGTEAPEKGPNIWPGHKYPDTRWGLAIDLSKCTGCGACTIACQAENNIPTAGKKGVIKGREMHWLRVDRYYSLPVPRTSDTPEQLKKVEEAREAAKNREWLDNPEVLFHPLMCQHCENAPCETVCPVGATTHSSDGLNMQAYNRCVGTRYCSNNCPFKARRFNWFDYTKAHDSFMAKLFQPQLPQVGSMNARWPVLLKNNPEVTVRSRGVMEKCTMCVQRIAVGRGKAKDEDRKVKDGDIQTACQQTCPSRAIVFGNLADPDSEVSRLRQSKRGLHMLQDQNVGSSVTYLSKVRNDES